MLHYQYNFMILFWYTDITLLAFSVRSYIKIQVLYESVLKYGEGLEEFLKPDNQVLVKAHGV